MGKLIQLENESANVTQISKKLGLSLPEANRHVSRLGEVGLTWKDNEGLYHLTRKGEPGMPFLIGVYLL